MKSIANSGEVECLELNDYSIGAKHLPVLSLVVPTTANLITCVCLRLLSLECTKGQLPSRVEETILNETA